MHQLHPSYLINRCVLLAAALCGLPAGLQAQSSTQPPDSAAQKIEGAVIQARRSPAVVGGAAAVVVRPDSLRLGPAATLDDVLRTLPLVLVRQNSRGEAELSTRGSDSRQVGVVLDGLPLSYGWDGRADLSLVPVTGVTSVTVTRGLGTLLAGPNTLGGVVELRLDEPVREAGWRSQLSIGTDQTGARQTSLGSATTRALGAGRLTLRAGAAYRQREGFVRAGGIHDVRNDQSLRVGTDLEELDGFGHMSWRLSNGAAIGATVTSYDASRGVAPELHIAAPRFWRYPEARRAAVMLRAAAPQFTSDAGLTRIEASIGHVAGRTLIEQFGNASYLAVTGTERGEESTLTARAQLQQVFPNSATITTAATQGRVDYDETLNTSPKSRYQQQLTSVGVEGRFPIGTRSLLGGGIVFDRATTPEAGGRALQPEQSGTGWRIGGTSEVSAGWRVHASVSERARFPALRELYSGALNRFEPNPALKPERLLVTETGVTIGDAEAIGRWSLQTTLFHQQLQDGIVRITQADRKFKRINQNEQVTTGIETMLGWRGGVTQPSLLLDLVAQRIRIATPAGTVGPVRPEHQPNIRGGADALIPVGMGVLAGMNVTYTGRQYCLNPDLGQSVELKAQSLAGVTVERQWAIPQMGAFRTLRVLVGADNVANAAVFEQCGLPRAGRTFRLSLQVM